MKVVETRLPGVLVIEPTVHGDSRGCFFESWHKERYSKLGVEGEFLQDNISFSSQGILRGLHFQNPNQQGKLVYVLRGSVFDVAVDIRRGSPTFGQWIGETLSASNKLQLYIPKGFAHGFVSLEDDTVFAYKCSDVYNSKAEHVIAWNDPELGIDWPGGPYKLSDRDSKAPLLKEINPKILPVYGKEINVRGK